MSFFDRLGLSSTPATVRASNASDYNQAFFSGEPMPESWTASLTAAGVNVTPDLAMTLSAYYCGVTTIAYDLATLTLRAFKTRKDGGKDLVPGYASGHEASISSLIYKLQWQPNNFQTAAEFQVGQIAQLLLRNRSYAEIVPGPGGFLDQLLPRHPDRVTPERLPSGRWRYKLTEANGSSRYVTQEEMHVVRDLSISAADTLSRISYGANAIATALAAERASGKFFKSGMTAAKVATYKGEMEDEDEDALHKSISRFAAGVENSFGLMLVPDDVTITNLGVDPDKAQMMLAREWTVYEVARQLRIQPRKLMSGKNATYASAYQDAIDHVVNCLRPLAVLIQQSIQRDLVLAKDTYQFVFHLGELLKGDPAQMGDFIEKMISSRAMTPSEVRMAFLDLNPDPHLDQLSETDNRPGQAKPSRPASAPAPPASAAASIRPLLAKTAGAVTCVRRERAAVTRLAQKHASDVAGWQEALRGFAAEQAQFVSRTMGISIELARGYCAAHGSAFEANGVAIIDGDAGTDWERDEAAELAELAINNEAAA